MYIFNTFTEKIHSIYFKAYRIKEKSTIIL